MDDSIYTNSGQGQLASTSTLTLDQIAERIVAFVRTQLPNWRDDPDRGSKRNENTLNSELCDFLDAQARHNFKMVRFHHQQDEDDSKRSTDFAAKSVRKTWYANDYCSIYKPLVVFEGKRLPAPTGNREHEYVSGLSENSGGIQRFKMGVHGEQCRVGVLIGYIQQNVPTFWHNRINGWINELAHGTLSDGQSWSGAEQLGNHREDDDAGTSSSQSEHVRPSNCVTNKILLHHLWIVMVV